MSRAGSQVMKIGRMGWDLGEVVVEGEMGGVIEEDGGVCVVGAEGASCAFTRSIIWAILSSSSGQMSGQWEKPK